MIEHIGVPLKKLFPDRYGNSEEIPMEENDGFQQMDDEMNLEEELMVCWITSKCSQAGDK